MPLWVSQLTGRDSTRLSSTQLTLLNFHLTNFKVFILLHWKIELRATFVSCKRRWLFPNNKPSGNNERNPAPANSAKKKKKMACHQKMFLQSTYQGPNSDYQRWFFNAMVWEKVLPEFSSEWSNYSTLPTTQVRTALNNFIIALKKVNVNALEHRLLWDQNYVSCIEKCPIERQLKGVRKDRDQLYLDDVHFI